VTATPGTATLSLKIGGNFMQFAKGAFLGIAVSVVASLTWWATLHMPLRMFTESLTNWFIVLAFAVLVTETAVRGFTAKPPALVARFFVGVQIGVGLTAVLAFWGLRAYLFHIYSHVYVHP
jgi:uncharacterized membrane protein (DUF441 family)